ncbi:MAG TPA: archease [Candidatus Binataceae bacterium]|nr:archease [Candidatus Binataceae bacterium]
MRREDIPPFREFEHTGDLGIEVVAASRGELFRCAAIGLASPLVEMNTIEAKKERGVVVEAQTDADLTHDLLAELLYFFDPQGFIWRDASVKEEDRSLRVTLRGERFDPARHVFRREIKAITYHQLMVTQSPNGWLATVIFDI